MVAVFFIIITDIPFLIQANRDLAPFVLTFGLSISTLGSAVSGLAFSRMYTVLKKWIVPIGLMICAVGFLLTVYAGNSYLVLTGLFCTGLGWGFVISLVVLKVTNAVGEDDSTAALSVLSSAFSVGIFISPFFFL